MKNTNNTNATNNTSTEKFIIKKEFDNGCGCKHYGEIIIAVVIGKENADKLVQELNASNSCPYIDYYACQMFDD